MKIQAQDLHRMAYNAIQFSAKDSTVGGRSLWSIGREKMYVWATDDYVALRDSAPVEEWSVTRTLWSASRTHGDPSFTLTLADLKGLEKHLRDRDDHLDFTVDKSGLSLGDFTLPIEQNESILEPAVQVIHEATPSLIYSIGPLAIRQDRFSKFRLLKTPGQIEYPIDLAPGSTPDGRVMMLWKFGPYLRGVIGQMDREYLQDYFSDDLEVLW